MTVIEVTARPVLLLGWDPEREASPTGVPGGVSFGTAKANAVVEPVGVAGSVTFGTADVLNNLTQVRPDGIAGVTDEGDPQLNAAVSPTGIASTLVFGVNGTGIYVEPDGIDADTEAFGTPVATTVLRPSGTASTLAIGDVRFTTLLEADATGLGSTIEFGTTQVINRRLLFRTPRNTYQWRLFKEYEGISLLKENGVWSEVAHPDLERTKAAEIYLGGGRDHVLSNALLSELQAAGYPYIEEIVP